MNRNTESKNLCPLCDSEVFIFKGSYDNGGEKLKPSVKCGCGFYYEPSTKLHGIVGEDGWQHSDRQFKADIEKIEKLTRRNFYCEPSTEKRWSE